MPPLTQFPGNHSKRKAQRYLQLSRVANALSQKSVEVEKPRRAERIDVVRVIEGIKHLNDGNQRITLAEFEWPLDTPIE